MAYLVKTDKGCVVAEISDSMGTFTVIVKGKKLYETAVVTDRGATNLGDSVGGILEEVVSRTDLIGDDLIHLVMFELRLNRLESEAYLLDHNFEVKRYRDQSAVRFTFYGEPKEALKTFKIISLLRERSGFSVAFDREEDGYFYLLPDKLQTLIDNAGGGLTKSMLEEMNYHIMDASEDLLTYEEQ
jgi:hypothetical protein